jgi:DNA-binding IclR family transcriptional regulator
VAESSRDRLRMVLEVLVSRDYVSPGDVVVATGLPRYLVLAMFQCLEALGVVEQVYGRGSYKVYTATVYAGKILEALKSPGEVPVLTALLAGVGAPAAVAGEKAGIEA